MLNMMLCLFYRPGTDAGATGSDRIMATHVFTIPGRITVEAHVTIGGAGSGGYAMPGAQSVGAYGIAFDDDANTVGDTSEHRYIDYCPSGIAYHELHRLIAGRWGIESEGIAAAVDALMPPCECE